jgi:hypothetical protein
MMYIHHQRIPVKALDETVRLSGEIWCCRLPLAYNQGGAMSTEPTREPEPRIVEGDYRLTRSKDGITIEVLDYHADPLRLTDEVLKKLGVTITRAPKDH